MSEWHIRFGTAGTSDSFEAKGYKSSLDIPAYTAEMGLDAFEYQCGHGVRLGVDKAGKMAADAAERGILFSVHAPYYISMSSLEEEKQKAEEAARIKKEADDAIAKVEELKKESGQSTENKDTPSTSIGMIAQNPNVDNGTTKEQTNQSSQGSTSQNTGNTAGPGGDGSNTSTGSSTGTSGSYQDTQNGPGSSVYDSAVRTAIVAYAKQFLGNPYVYGGTSLTNGADCSGFTMRIFEHFGVSTGRTSRDQASNGKQISLSEIQPGDLLFYASGKTINHVALYIGDGKIIHASTSKTGIIISNAYYRTPAKAVTFLN